MDIIDLPIKAIKPYKNNPRHNDKAVEYVANSIREFGFKQPIVIDDQYEIVCGHTRWKAAKAIGLETVPCVMADDLTPEQIQAYRLADNKTAEMADWDFELLEQELNDIDPAMFDMADFGFFQGDEISKNEPKEVTDDDFNPDEEVESRCKRGQVWQLGAHRLMCGDSTNVEKLMNGEKADIAFTSPPYNAGKSAKLTGNTHMTECKYESGEDDLSNYDELLEKSTDNMISNAKYAFVNLQMLSNNKKTVIDWVHNHKDELCDVAIWYKSSTAPAMAERVMNSQFEFVFVFSKKNNSRAIGTKKFRGTVSNVYEGSAQRKNEYAEIHSATFPMEFVVHFISNFTNEDDVVLDVFGGTGTTMIACEQLNRKCYMCELDPHYCDVIIKRWEDFTGQKAVLLEE